MNNPLKEARDRRRNQSNSSHQHEKNGLDMAKEDVRSLTAKLLHTLAMRFSGDDIVNMLEKALSATKVAKIKNEEGKTEDVDVPDFRTRLDAVRLILSYTAGTPVQREERVNYNMDMSDLDGPELIELLSQSPAMLQKIKGMIAEAEAKMMAEHKN